MLQRKIEVAEPVEFNIPAAWPAADVPTIPAPANDARLGTVAAPAVAEQSFPAPLAADVPAGVGGLLLFSYGAMFTTLLLTMTGSAQALFVVVIAVLCVSSIFIVPGILIAAEPLEKARPSLDRFLAEGIGTGTGHSTGKDALVQMLIVPVLLTFALIAMGITAQVVLS